MGSGPADPTTRSPLTLVLLVGLPGSGKSTFYRERLADTHVHVSKDLMPRSSDKARRQRGQIEAALSAGLSAGLSVAVDNTNASRAERAAAIDAARPFGARVVVVRFDESLAVCRERNALREGAARVPDVALHVTKARYQEPAPEEGIDEIRAVRLGPDGFILEA